MLEDVEQSQNVQKLFFCSLLNPAENNNQLLLGSHTWRLSPEVLVIISENVFLTEFLGNLKQKQKLTSEIFQRGLKGIGCLFCSYILSKSKIKKMFSLFQRARGGWHSTRKLWRCCCSGWCAAFSRCSCLRRTYSSLQSRLE